VYDKATGWLSNIDRKKSDISSSLSIYISEMHPSTYALDINEINALKNTINNTNLSSSDKAILISLIESKGTQSRVASGDDRPGRAGETRATATQTTQLQGNQRILADPWERLIKCINNNLTPQGIVRNSTGGYAHPTFGYLEDNPVDNILGAIGDFCRVLKNEDTEHIEKLCASINNLMLKNNANTQLRSDLRLKFNSHQLLRGYKNLVPAVYDDIRVETASVKKDSSIYTRETSTLASLRSAANAIAGGVTIRANTNIIAGLPPSGLYIRGEDGSPLIDRAGGKIWIEQKGSSFFLNGTKVSLRIAGDNDTNNSGKFTIAGRGVYAHVVVFDEHENHILWQGKASMGR
jgi:hypothetical protein